MTAPLNDRLLSGFAAAFGGAPALVIRAPGRVNLIGEHTDYNDGFAMPMAIGQETRVAFRPAAGPLNVAALDFAEADSFDPAAPSRTGGWRDYVRGVVAQLVAAGITVPGGDLAIAGTIAKGTGLSSSASLEVAVARAMLEVTGQSWDAVRVALLAQRAECDFVGVRCGNLDQIASAATTSGHALLIDCRTLALRQIAMPDDVAVMIVQSGVVRGLVDGEYNRRREECERAARILGVGALRDADEPLLESARSSFDDLAFLRARHVITENRRTLDAAQALATGDLVRVGALMRESHASQHEDFGITVPFTHALAELMSEAIGPEGGARQTGGGFGGAVVGLMRKDRLAAVREAVLENYRTPAGARPEICEELPAAGAGLAT
ncbi:galactokinase [Novosphingobium sp. SL115]|uniref:galactokinase n=1 Tax=Novosphingobium sp. SL115 TaxID=2995150 RepID=UPI002273B037|nr:galactokinase [Novosphingobium sp. SL115]MCY1670133.1 galactokinase [Novosphingobium sp. SL115]